ncbi:MAG TPA: 2-oxoacid:acceptor oxidoreductase subunit alpha, partial [Deltaproteobacteria bacterium]|nr:2-oxoacid:acceptor oxidoreductase subunit alpha [Deltaproteobacteria bacterium]
MVEKRLLKLRGLEEECIEPTLTGGEDYRHLVVGWGSTGNVVREALLVLRRKDLSFLHFSQVYPLHPKTASLIGRAQKRIVIENNATSQFARLVRMHTGIAFDASILKFDGWPFLLEEVVERLEALL